VIVIVVSDTIALVYFVKMDIRIEYWCIGTDGSCILDIELTVVPGY